MLWKYYKNIVNVTLFFKFLPVFQIPQNHLSLSLSLSLILLLHGFHSLVPILNSGFATLCFCCCSFLLSRLQVCSLYVCFYMRFFLANNMSFFNYILLLFSYLPKTLLVSANPLLDYYTFSFFLAKGFFSLWFFIMTCLI